MGENSGTTIPVTVEANAYSDAVYTPVQMKCRRHHHRHHGGCEGELQHVRENELWLDGAGDSGSGSVMSCRAVLETAGRRVGMMQRVRGRGGWGEEVEVEMVILMLDGWFGGVGLPGSALG